MSEASFKARYSKNRKFQENVASSFREYFNGPSLWTSPQLWKEYQLWSKQNIYEDYARFKNYVLELSASIRKEVENWPNPLANGRKNELYESEFSVPENIDNYIFYGLDKAGLKFEKDPRNPHKCRIYGLPSQSGNFEIKFVYTWKKAGKVYGYFVRPFSFYINADPRELWKDIPSDSFQEYYKADAAQDILSCGSATLVAASRRGRSHAHQGLCRDDDFALGCINGWSILAVADGAGSAPFSRKGSAMACEIALEVCKEKLNDNFALDAIFGNLTASSPETWINDAKKLAYAILPQAFFSAFKAIREEAQSHERNIKEYATTLLLAVCKKYPHGWIVMSFQIGDGAMAILYDDKAILLAVPDEGEYGGQTRFITMNDMYESVQLMQRLRIDFVPKLDMLVLMSDGVSDPLFSTLDNLNNASLWRKLVLDLEKHLQSANIGENLLEWLNFWVQGNHDDRTIAIWRGEKS